MLQEYFNLAKEESKLSTDLRRPIGVVIVNNFKVIGRGSNQATIKWKWLINWHKNHCLRKIIGIKGHVLYWVCPGCALYRNHAEIRAIRSIKDKKITGLVDMFMYGHNEYCNNCEVEIKKFNINKVYFKND